MVQRRQLANVRIQKDHQDPMAQNRQLTNITTQRDHLLHEEWTAWTWMRSRETIRYPTEWIVMDETACRGQAPLNCCCLTLYRTLQLKVRKSENVGTHELIKTITLERNSVFNQKTTKDAIHITGSDIRKQSLKVEVV